jgi:hypothetical protein
MMAMLHIFANPQIDGIFNQLLIERDVVAVVTVAGMEGE